MSSVPRRLRKTTDLQAIITAQDLQISLTKYVLNDKNVPKKWRIVIVQPLISDIDSIVDNLTWANSIYAQTEEDWKERENCQLKAMRYCWQVHNKIVRMIECVPSVNVDSMEVVLSNLTDTLDLIKNWRKSDKERMKKQNN